MAKRSGFGSPFGRTSGCQNTCSSGGFRLNWLQLTSITGFRITIRESSKNTSYFKTIRIHLIQTQLFDMPVPTRSRVSLQIYNILGQVVANLINTEQSEGWNQVVWNAEVSSGCISIQLKRHQQKDPSKRFVETKKMILLK